MSCKDDDLNELKVLFDKILKKKIDEKINIIAENLYQHFNIPVDEIKFYSDYQHQNETLEEDIAYVMINFRKTRDALCWSNKNRNEIYKKIFNDTDVYKFHEHCLTDGRYGMLFPKNKLEEVEKLLKENKINYVKKDIK